MKNKLLIIAGPCVVQDLDTTYQIAKKCKKVCEKYNTDFIFKASFKKANRTKLESFSGINRLSALEILKKVKEDLGILTITDIHETIDCEIVSKYVDYAQIPAFLCRQTELLTEASKYFKKVNIKKGQWMSHKEMIFAKNKVLNNPKSISKNVFLTERGNIFGYNNLIVDFTNISEMKVGKQEETHLKLKQLLNVQ